MGMLLTIIIDLLNFHRLFTQRNTMSNCIFALDLMPSCTWTSLQELERRKWFPNQANEEEAKFNNYNEILTC